MERKNDIGPLAVRPEEAARALGIGRNLVYGMISNGTIRAVRLGERRLLVPVAELERLLNIDHSQAAGQ